MSTLSQKGRIGLPILLVGIGILSGLAVGAVAVLLTDKDDSDLSKNEYHISQSTTEHAEEQSADLLADTKDSMSDIKSLITLLDSVNRVERLTVLYNLVQTTSVKKLETLLEQSVEERSTHLRNEMQKALVQGLATHDPEHALTLLENLEGNLEPSLLGLVYQEWVIKDYIDQPFEEADKLSEPKKRIAVEGILNTAVNIHLSENGRRLHSGWLGLEQIAIDQIAVEILHEDILDPEKAWKRFTEASFNTKDPYSTVQQRVITEIAHAWIIQDGKEALQTINNALFDRDDYVLLVGQILENTATDNPHQALDMASTIKLRSHTILTRLISSAANVNPRTALDAASSFPMLKMRERLQQLAIAPWVASAPLEVLNQLDQIPANVRQWSQQKALLAITKDSPKTAASFLPSVDNIGIRESIANAIVHQWAKNDHKEVLQWVNSNSDISDWKESLHTHILRSLAQEDVQLAMKLALDRPITAQSKIGSEAIVIEEVAGFNVDEAIVLLNSARNEATVQRAHKAIGNVLVVKGRSNLAIELVAEAPPEVQYEYFDYFGNTWAYYDPEDLYKKLDRLPSEKIAENLGTSLAAINSHVQVLTPEQKKALAKYVPRALRGMLD